MGRSILTRRIVKDEGMVQGGRAYKGGEEYVREESSVMDQALFRTRNAFIILLAISSNDTAGFEVYCEVMRFVYICRDY